MKKYTITDKEWESVLEKVQTLEKENHRLTGVIEGMERAFSLYSVSQQSELVCPAGYYPNYASTGLECVHCGRDKYAH